MRGWFPQKCIRIIKASRVSQHDNSDQEDIRKQEKDMKGDRSGTHVPKPCWEHLAYLPTSILPIALKLATNFKR